MLLLVRPCKHDLGEFLLEDFQVDEFVDFSNEFALSLDFEVVVECVKQQNPTSVVEQCHNVK